MKAETAARLKEAASDVGTAIRPWRPRYAVMHVALPDFVEFARFMADHEMMGGFSIVGTLPSRPEAFERELSFLIMASLTRPEELPAECEVEPGEEIPVVKLTLSQESYGHQRIVRISGIHLWSKESGVFRPLPRVAG